MDNVWLLECYLDWNCHIKLFKPHNAKTHIVAYHHASEFDSKLCLAKGSKLAPQCII